MVYTLFNRKLYVWVSWVVLVVKNLPVNAGDVRNTDLILGLGRFPRRSYSNLLQYFCLENPMDGGAWWATVLRVIKSQTPPKWLSTYVCSIRNI